MDPYSSYFFLLFQKKKCCRAYELRALPNQALPPRGQGEGHSFLAHRTRIRSWPRSARRTAAAAAAAVSVVFYGNVENCLVLFILLTAWVYWQYIYIYFKYCCLYTKRCTNDIKLFCGCCSLQEIKRFAWRNKICTTGCISFGSS